MVDRRNVSRQEIDALDGEAKPLACTLDVLKILADSYPESAPEHTILNAARNIAAIRAAELYRADLEEHGA